MNTTLTIPTASVFEPLLAPARYKGAFGGRGSGKSHFFAGLLIDDCLRQKGLRAICIREAQKSLKESAKRLIEGKLADYRLGEADGFKIYSDVIKTPGDGLIMFLGMQDHNAESIKSLEGAHRAWVEEAQMLSEHSLSLLRPTIRTEDSELWFSWNPRLARDPVDQLLRGASKPEGAKVVKANWSDNPWFPNVLEAERIDCMRKNPDNYPHIWEGDYVATVEGAYFAKSLTEARAQGRLAKVARDPLMQIRTYWDIGVSDACAIWVAQFVGNGGGSGEIRVLDYYEASGQPLAAHLDWLRSRGYSNALCVLPHDGARRDVVTAAKFEDHIGAAGFEVKTIPNQGKGAAMKRVEATRRRFPLCWFNEETCDGGLKALGWYHEKKDDARGLGLGPDHDWSSHGADAFGLMAIDYEEPSNDLSASFEELDQRWVV